jgi:chromosome segregation ATPase
MSSPKARRRQRSTRLTVAVVLVMTAAALVLGALVSRSSVAVAVAAVAAVVLGAAATRITHSELMQSRRDAARDRAEQAQAYRTLAAARAEENATHVASLEGQIGRREAALRELEEALVSAQHRAAEATRKRNAEARRADLAEQEGVDLSRRLEDAEERAAEAIVHLAELEQEVDVLRSELAAWQTFAQTGHPGELRRHA